MGKSASEGTAGRFGAAVYTGRKACEVRLQILKLCRLDEGIRGGRDAGLGLVLRRGDGGGGADAEV